jgi:hypothetical protein
MLSSAPCYLLTCALRLCRFFLTKRDFLLEIGFCENSAFRQCLPELAYATDNEDGRVVSRSGYRFPPFLVLDRGVTLVDWLHVKRNPSAVLGMAIDVLELLEHLHSSGFVHRDLKPDNLIFILHTQQWRLLDFGITATAGANLGYKHSGTLMYTAAGVTFGAIQVQSARVSNALFTVERWTWNFRQKKRKTY